MLERGGGVWDALAGIDALDDAGGVGFCFLNRLSWLVIVPKALIALRDVHVALKAIIPGNGRAE